MEHKNETINSNSEIGSGITFETYGEYKRTLEKLLSLPNTGIAISSPEKGWILVSDALCEILEYTREELFQTTWAQITHPDDTEKDLTQFNKILNGEINKYHLNKRYISKTGQTIHVELSVDCIRRDDGSVKYLIAVVHDITKLMELTKSLSGERQKYLLTLQSIGDGVISTDADGNIQFMNSVAEDLTGWTTDDAKDNDLQTVFHVINADTRERVENPVDKVKRKGVTVGLANHTVLISKKGDEIVIADSAAPIQDDAGDLVGIVMVFRDMRKEEQMAAEEREKNRLSAMLDALPSNVYIVDPNTYEILYVNQALARTFNDDLVGKKCYEALQGFDEPCEFCTNEIILETPEEPYKWEYHNPISDADYYIHDQMIRWPDGRMVRFESALDISERKRLIREKNIAIKHEIERLQTILDSLPFIIYIVDPETYEIIFVNKKLADTFETKLVGKTCYRALQNKDEPCEFCTNDIIMKNPGEPYEWEFHNPLVNIDYLISDRMIKWPDGRLLRFESALDITEKNKLIDELSETKNRFSTLVNNIPQRVFHKNSDSIYMACNEPYAEDLNTTSKAIIGTTDFDHYPKEMAKKYRADDQRIMEQGEIVQFEEEYVKNGQKRIVETTKVPLRDRNREVMGLLGVFSDITERKKLEKERQKALYDLRERVKEMTCVDQISDLVQETNSSFAEKMKIAVDKIPPGFLHPDRTSVRISVLEEEYKSENFTLSKHTLSAPIYQQYLPVNHNDDKIDINYSTEKNVGSVEVFYLPEESAEEDFNPFLVEEENLVKRIADIISKLVTKEKYQESIIRTAKRLKQSNRELEQFAYVASHDLQEPLRMVSSYLQLIERRYKGELDKDADEFIAYAVDGANRMKKLIQDLLSFSRVTTRGNKATKFNPIEIIKDIEVSHKIIIEENNAKLLYTEFPEIKADRSQFKMILTNLIQNAIKFRSDQDPKIKIECKETPDYWTFSVEDNGIGFESKYADRIFNIFERLHSSDEYSGTGIGLALVKRIIERHHGKVWAESDGEGKGSSFHFTIPKNGGEYL